MVHLAQQSLNHKRVWYKITLSEHHVSLTYSINLLKFFEEHTNWLYPSYRFKVTRKVWHAINQRNRIKKTLFIVHQYIHSQVIIIC